ncbi:MAG: RNA repair transcriptional activator RtcR family protein [Ignavibacterium sp.]|nr:RNA repair transcriptional activator RtcR family protein [Ignavibacterium sp.]
MKKILISFVGINDSGKLTGESDGAIITALTNEKFDEVYLIWNKSSRQNTDFKQIADYLKKEIKKRKLASKSHLIELPIKDVTDHNHIYKLLKNFTDTLDKSENYSYTAAISSGTPAMQVCWILLAESGDFSENNPLRLIKVKDPRFGKSENVDVKIDTSLPRIVRLKEQVESLKKDLIPQAVITISKPSLKIGDVLIPLTPIELCYFRYFAERVLNDEGDEHFPIYSTSQKFLERIIELHKEFFPDNESGREDLIRISKQKFGLDITTFRGNVSKLNKKVKTALQNDSIANNFIITSEGLRGAKYYGIRTSPDKIKIVN